MISGLRVASVASAAALVLSLSPVAASAAGQCASRSEVRTKVAALVHSMVDDVESRPARAATAKALVEVDRTFRGAKADTAAERRGLGEEISAYLRQLRTAHSRVEGTALAAYIESLRVQRDGGALTAAERAELRADVAALKAALVDRTDRPAEARGVSAAVRYLQSQYGCHA